MIRIAELKDLNSIVEIETTFGAEAFSKESLRYHINKGMTLVIDEGDVRGYSIVLVRRNSAIARLYSIAIAEPYRGYGYGQALLAASESFAVGLGATQIRLEVAETNQPARTLYESRGYTALKRIEGYYSDGQAAIRLQRLLERSEEAF